MTTRISLVFIVLLLIGCSSRPVQDEGDLPIDLSDLKALRKDKRKEIKQLQRDLNEIETKIADLEPDRPDRKRLVTTREVVRTDFKRYAKIQGAIASKHLVSVSSEMPGRLTAVTVDEGYPVKRGQLIASVDMESLQKQRQELETQLDLARDIFERQDRLWKQEIGSEVQYLQAKNAVDRLEKSIETIDYSLTKSNIYAPITGVVDIVNFRAGEMAQPGMPIVMILDTRNIMVVADVPENYLGKINKGDFVNIHFPALNQDIEARVTLIGRKIHPANRTFKIEIDLPNKSGLLKPNLLAEVQINDYLEPDVIVISQELIQQEVGGRDFVVLAEISTEGSRARKVYVETGQSYEGDVVVTSGLVEGDVLVVDGARGIAEAEHIEIHKPESATNGE
jgi:RND family efflux transporter MFP subunit